MTASEGQAQLDRLASDAASIYQDAFRWFRAQGPAAAPVLLRGLEDKSLGSTCRWRILLLLRELALPATLPVLLHAFREAWHERNPILLPGAMEALAAFEERSAVEALVSVLDGGDDDFANHAAALLGDRAARGGEGAGLAEAALVAMLGRGDAASRASAVRGLLRAGTAPAREALVLHRRSERDASVLELLKELK